MNLPDAIVIPTGFINPGYQIYGENDRYRAFTSIFLGGAEAASRNDALTGFDILEKAPAFDRVQIPEAALL